MGFHRVGNRTYWVEVYAHPEDLPIGGNVLASGNFDEDRAAENLVREQLADGNEWAWCLVQVEVTDMDSDDEATESEYLGGCSYKSRRDFITSMLTCFDPATGITTEAGYYDDMVAACIERLNKRFLREGATG